jgi:hypothetical protein
VIEECGKKYNFDSEDAKRILDVEHLCFNEYFSESSSSLKKVSKESKKVFSKCIPLPYSGVIVECNCDGLSYNHGLYTQCENVKSGDRFCESCDKEAKKNESGEPDNGTIESRKAVDVFDYVDSKGKSATVYMKVMKKLKLSKEEVLEEGKKRNIFIDERHLEIGELKRGRPKTVGEKSPKGAKGRPKKSKKTLELSENNNEEDLFACLVAAANKEVSAEDTVVEVSAEDTVVEVSAEDTVVEVSAEDTVVEVSAEDTVVEVSASVEAQEAAINDATVVKEKVEKPKKELKEKVEKPKKEPKEKVEKPKKEPKEKDKKEPKEKVEKPKKEPKEKVEKPKKEPKEKDKKEPKEKVEKPKKETEEKPKEEEEADVVKRFEFEGVKYLKSKKSGVIYNMDQDVIGKWNEKENKIDFNECESEEEEEEYDED